MNVPFINLPFLSMLIQTVSVSLDNKNKLHASYDDIRVYKQQHQQGFDKVSKAAFSWGYRGRLVWSFALQQGRTYFINSAYKYQPRWMLNKAEKVCSFVFVMNCECWNLSLSISNAQSAVQPLDIYKFISLSYWTQHCGAKQWMCTWFEEECVLTLNDGSTESKLTALKNSKCNEHFCLQGEFKHLSCRILKSNPVSPVNIQRALFTQTNIN